MSDNKPVTTLAEAKTGDWVWVYHSERSRYDEDGKYLGRGDWYIAQVASETRKSFNVDRIKFNRTTGQQMCCNKYGPKYQIYGNVDKTNKDYVRKHKYQIVRIVGDCNDANLLKKIADLVGYVTEE